MARFKAVTAQDFWHKETLLFIDYYTGLSTDWRAYAKALANQINQHRKLSEIAADQATAAAGKKEQNNTITTYTRYVNNLYKEWPNLDTGIGSTYDALRADRDAYREKIRVATELRDKQYNPWIKFLQKEYDAEVKREKKLGIYKPPSTGGSKGGKVGLVPVTYNVGAVKEAYYSSKASFSEVANTKYTNTPAAISNASELWTSAGGHKGMIQTWSEIGKNQQFTDAENKTANITIQNYGFQFLYNPASIEMGYSGIPDVDITMYTSGKIGTNLWAPNSFQSTIRFELLINRMFDLQYYDKDAKRLSTGVIASSIYTGRIPNAKDQELISEKGTMYDIEYLLSTTIGFKQNTRWRGETSDLGWVSAMPVELHLGKNLRYLVVVSGVNVRHVIFDERMVPLFSVLTIQCQRIPDYPTTKDSSSNTYDDRSSWQINGTGPSPRPTIKVGYDTKTGKPTVQEWTYDFGTGGGSWKDR